MFSIESEISSLIQLAVAPVFFLAGIAGFLGVMSGRLGRIIDRERVLSRRLQNTEDDEVREISGQEYQILTRRGQAMNNAIGLCTTSALVVCSVIVCIFMSALFQLDMATGTLKVVRD